MASDLTAVLGLDAQPFKKGLSEAKNGMGDFGKTMGGIASGMAAFAGVATAIDKVGASINKAANLSDAAANVGMTVEEFQKLGFAYRDVGLSSGEMESHVGKMNTVLGEAIGGSTSANEALNKLGLTIDGIKNMSAADQFETIVKAISKLPTQAERAAAATDFFGKSGKKLDQLVMGFDAVMQKAEEAGNMIGQDTADNADKLGDELAKLDDAFTALVANSGFIDFLGSAVKSMVDLQNSVKGGVDALLNMEAKLKDVKGQDLSGTGAYSGGFLGFVANGSEAWFGESEGAKITTGKATDAERRELRKRQEEKKKLAEEQAIAEKKMADEAAKKLSEKSDKEAAKEAKAKAKEEKDTKQLVEGALDSADDVLSGTRKAQQEAIIAEGDKAGEDLKAITNAERELELQGLLNAGKQREAEIQKAINQAKDQGMSEDDQKTMGRLAGMNFDLKNIPKQQFATEHTDDYLRKGLTVGNAGSSINPLESMQKKGIELLAELNRNLKEQTEKWERLNQANGGNGV